MSQQFNAEWARGIIDGGMEKAQGLISDPDQMDGLLQQLQEKLKTVPGELAGALASVPLMASMVKSYVTREYADVSPKVVISLVSAFLYLVKGRDLIPDAIPVIGLADDVAVIALAMKINEPELQAYAAWRDANKQAAGAEGAADIIELPDSAVIIEDAAPEAPQA